MNEINTMVLGISLSNSTGAHHSYSVIGVPATLDESCMNLAQSVYACTRTKIIDKGQRNQHAVIIAWMCVSHL